MASPRSGTAMREHGERKASIDFLMSEGHVVPGDVQVSRLRTAVRWIALIATGIVLALAAPIVVAWLDRALVHHGGYMEDRAFLVHDSTGNVIGHGYAYWMHTTINIGRLQARAPRDTDRKPRGIPSWATVEIPPPFTAATTMASGWPAAWHVSTTYIDHDNLAAGVKDGPSTKLWLSFGANVIFFVILLLVIGQGGEVARRVRGRLRTRRQRCPNCNYNLTSLRGSRCPECGHEIGGDRRVGLLVQEHPDSD